jgi:hypothetical protein
LLGAPKDAKEEFLSAGGGKENLFLANFAASVQTLHFGSGYPEHCRKGLNALLLETVAFIFSTCTRVEKLTPH